MILKLTHYPPIPWLSLAGGLVVWWAILLQNWSVVPGLCVV